MSNDPRHDALMTIAGDWEGTVRMWFEPASTPTANPITVSARRAAYGQALSFTYEGAHGDEPMAGIATFGYDVNKERHTAAWIDCWHTGTGLMVSEGAPTADRLLDVATTYDAGGETWGWRTTLMTEGDELVWAMYNRGPALPEYLAVEARLVRRDG